MSIEDQIADTTRVINGQIKELARARYKLTLNLFITEDGKIGTVSDAGYLKNSVDDCENRLKDLLRLLDELLKERDGIAD